MSFIFDQLLFALVEAVTGETVANKNVKIDKISKMRFIIMPFRIIYLIFNEKSTLFSV